MTSRQIPNGLAGASVAVMELLYCKSVGQRQNLMTKADPHGRNLFIGQCLKRFNSGGVILRIAGTCGEYNTVGRKRQNRFGRSIAGQHVNLTVSFHQIFHNTVLPPEIEQSNFILPIRIHHFRFLYAQICDHVFDLIGFQGFHIHTCRIGYNCTVHGPLFPQDLGQGSGIDTFQAGNPLLFQKIFQRKIRTEVGRNFSTFSYNQSCSAFAFVFSIFQTHTVVAAKRERLADCLSSVAGIGKGFHISDHGCGKHNLGNYITVRLKGFAGEYSAVFQN